MESLKASEPNEDSVEERSEGVEIGIGARLSVTQSDDPRSGGHFAVGMSKPPLSIRLRTCVEERNDAHIGGKIRWITYQRV